MTDWRPPTVSKYLLRLLILAVCISIIGLPGLGADLGSATLPPFVTMVLGVSDQQSPAAQPPNGSNTQTLPQTPPPKPADQNEKAKDDRMFYVMPNFLTVENEAKVPSLRWKQKFVITARGCFDPYEFVTAGILAGIRQAENAYPAFGQGAAGYGRRYGTAFADQVDANMMVGAVFPSVLRTDPRYFQLGRGKFAHRFGYALSRIFVTRKDSGGDTFNFSEPFGNASAIAISTLYYPSADRDLSSGLNGWGIQMAIDALGNELKEFWPDIHHAIIKHRHSDQPSN